MQVYIIFYSIIYIYIYIHINVYIHIYIYACIDRFMAHPFLGRFLSKNIWHFVGYSWDYWYWDVLANKMILPTNWEFDWPIWWVDLDINGDSGIPPWIIVENRIWLCDISWYGGATNWYGQNLRVNLAILTMAGVALAQYIRKNPSCGAWTSITTS